MTRLAGSRMAWLPKEKCGTHLKIACIRIDVIREIMIRVANHNIVRNKCFHFIERFLMFLSPLNKLAFAFSALGQVRQRRKDVRAARKHVTVKCNSSNERSHFLKRTRRSELQDSIDLFAPRFQTVRSHPISQPVCLLYTPFALQRVELLPILRG